MSLRRVLEKIAATMGKSTIVMEQTVKELMGLKRLALVITAGLIPAIFFGAVVWRESFRSGAMSLEMQTHTFVGYFLIFSFIWIAGFYIAYMIITTGMDFVSKEAEEGTLLLMVSKPIGRFQFILGKFLALLVTTLLIELVVLFGSILIFWALLGLEPESVRALVGLVFWIFLYSVLIAILFDALTIAISTLFKGKVIKTVLTMLLVMLVFGVGPILRMVWPTAYENYHLYYIDPGYHLGNAYVSASEQAISGRMTPQSQAYLGIFTGTYKAGMEELVLAMFTGSSESFDPDIHAMPPSLEQTDYLNPLVSVLLCLVVSAVALGGAKMAIERREVF
jgi:ABC-type transport system involved in multi-copper enzyme maturation permease subunit